MVSHIILLLVLPLVLSADSSAVDADADADTAKITNNDNTNLRRGRELLLQPVVTDVCWESAGVHVDTFCDHYTTLADGTNLQIREKMEGTDGPNQSPFCVGWSINTNTDCLACFASGEDAYPCHTETNPLIYDCSNISNDLCAKVDCFGECVNLEQGSICFSGTTTVTTKTKGVITMDKLELGDEVLIDAASETYEPVYSFGHRDRWSDGKFLQFLPSKLELSEDHMVFVQGGRNAVPASLIKVGDFLSSGQEVTAIKNVRRQGMYAPFTPSGTIMVNGVKASNYISLQKRSDTILVGSFSIGLSFHWVAHMSQLPHRIWCRMAKTCTEESYSEEGISKWVELQYYAFKWLFHPNNHIAIVALSIIPLVFFVVTFTIVDCLLTGAPILVVITLFAALLISRRLLVTATQTPKTVMLCSD